MQKARTATPQTYRLLVIGHREQSEQSQTLDALRKNPCIGVQAQRAIIEQGSSLLEEAGFDGTVVCTNAACQLRAGV